MSPRLQLEKEDEIFDISAKASEVFVEGMTKLGLRMSPMSVVLASNPELAKRMQTRLKKAGIDVQVASHGADLGAVCVAGGARRITLQVSRMKKVRSAVTHTLANARKACTPES